MNRPGAVAPDWTRGVPAVHLWSCDACGNRWYLPRPCCPRCRSADLRARPVAGSGEVAAVTVVRRAPVAEGTPRVPFALSLVDLDEGVRVMGHCDLDTRPGDRVQLYFPADRPQPHFRRHPPGSPGRAPANQEDA